MQLKWTLDNKSREIICVGFGKGKTIKSFRVTHFVMLRIIFEHRIKFLKQSDNIFDEFHFFGEFDFSTFDQFTNCIFIRFDFFKSWWNTVAEKVGSVFIEHSLAEICRFLGVYNLFRYPRTSINYNNFNVVSGRRREPWKKWYPDPVISTALFILHHKTTSSHFSLLLFSVILPFLYFWKQDLQSVARFLRLAIQRVE